MASFSSPPLPVKKSIDSVVFGSSLTKGLDEDLLSRRAKGDVNSRGNNFKVFSHGGAKIKTIINNIIKVKDDQELNTTIVSRVFIVCGGNDVENCYPESDLDKIIESYNELCSVATATFPNVSINLCSLIPRRTVYAEHKDRMLWVNDGIENFCKSRNIRYVDIFSHFIDHRSGDLSYKLFRGDELHLNQVGSSVLGKVIIAVANRPW